MVKKLFDSILGKSPVKNQDEYMELDLASYEGSTEEEPASMYIKIATIADLKDTPRVKDEVYNGDIVGLGEQKYVVITPMSVKVSREKIGGGL